MQALAEDRNIVIIKAEKGLTVVVWDRKDYTLEAEKQLSDANVYKDVFCNEKNLHELVGTSNQLFQNLKSKGKISDKQLKYFTYEYKKVSNLGKLYLLPKIHKRLHNVPGRPVISNCGIPTEALDNRENKQIPTENLFKMAEFVLKNNHFEFNGKVKKQLSGTAIGTKFAPTHGSIFMDKLESDFLNSQELT